MWVAKIPVTLEHGLVRSSLTETATLSVLHEVALASRKLSIHVESGLCLTELRELNPLIVICAN